MSSLDFYKIIESLNEIESKETDARNSKVAQIATMITSRLEKQNPNIAREVGSEHLATIVMDVAREHADHDIDLAMMNKMVGEVHSQLSPMDEATTQIQKQGNKVVVTKDGNKTEFDDPETAAMFMGDEEQEQMKNQGMNEDEYEHDYSLDDDEDDYEEPVEFHSGMPVMFKPMYADKPGEVFILRGWNGQRGRVEDKRGAGWNVRADQIVPATEDDIIDWGWPNMEESMSEGFEGPDAPKRIAVELKTMYDANENNCQACWDESPEPYRCIMYTLYPNAEDIDGTPFYWEIVRRFEGLLNNEPPVEDWDESLSESKIDKLEKKMKKEKVDEGDINTAPSWSPLSMVDECQPEYTTFDPENAMHRRGLQRGTPIVLHPDVCSDPKGDRTGIFLSLGKSGHWGKALRHQDGKVIPIHLSDINSADVTNNSVYESFNAQFNKLMEEVTITQTTNPTNPENNTMTVTGTGEDVDILAAILANAGLAGRPEAEPEMNVDMGEPEVEVVGDMGPEIEVEEGAYWDRHRNTNDWGEPVDDEREAEAHVTGNPSWLDDDEEEEWYAADGSVNPHGAYDAGGHYHAERDMGYEDMEEDRDIEYSNTPDEEYGDTDLMVNGLSGGLNGRKNMYRKEYPGDNMMAVREDDDDDMDDDDAVEEDRSKRFDTDYGKDRDVKEPSREFDPASGLFHDEDEMKPKKVKEESKVYEKFEDILSRIRQIEEASTHDPDGEREGDEEEELDEEFDLEEDQLDEKWGVKMKTKKKDRGMFKGRDKADLEAEYNKLKKSGPHKKGSAEYKKMKQLGFAIRAKGQGKKHWGKIGEGANSIPEVGKRVVVRIHGKKIPATISRVLGHDRFVIDGDLPEHMKLVKADPMGGFRLANDIERSPVMIESEEEGTMLDEKAPPGFDKELYKKIKAEYPGEPEKAYATMWSIHNKQKKESAEPALRPGQALDETDSFLNLYKRFTER